jgi:hypothetical protein
VSDFYPKRDQLLSGKKATYRGRGGNYVSFYNDASEHPKGTAGAFADMERAIRQAEGFIFITGWSFHPDFFLTRRANSKPIGELLLEKAAIVIISNADGHVINDAVRRILVE